MRFVILGAGPAGLGAAWALQQSGASWTLLEKNDRPGGLAASFVVDGFTWDIGGHILFSHYPAFDQVLDGVIPRDEWHNHERRAFIRMHDAWIPYPFQYNIRHLPSDEQRQCLEGVSEANSNRRADLPANFEEWIYRSMGKGVSDLFMMPYNRKVWAGPPSEMSAQWVGDRVAVPDLARMMRHLTTSKDDVSWGPNNLFRFPKSGGTGFIWRRVTDALPPERMLFNAPVVTIGADRRAVVTNDGRSFPYDVLISTIPIDQAVGMTGLDRGMRAARGLVRTSTWVVGLGLRGPLPHAAREKCWMYFPESEYPFYRVTVFSHYSPRNAPEGCYSLMAEVAFRPGGCLPGRDALVQACVQGLRRCGLLDEEAEPIHVWTHMAEYGYPVPSLGRDAILDEVLPALEKLGIYSRGRFGAWKYEVGNMDHTFMQGMEIAGRLLTGTAEDTLLRPEWVNRQR